LNYGRTVMMYEFSRVVDFIWTVGHTPVIHTLYIYGCVYWYVTPV